MHEQGATGFRGASGDVDRVRVPRGGTRRSVRIRLRKKISDVRRAIDHRRSGDADRRLKIAAAEVRGLPSDAEGPCPANGAGIRIAPLDAVAPGRHETGP